MEKPSNSNQAHLIAPVAPENLETFVQLLAEYSAVPGRGLTPTSPLLNSTEGLSRALFQVPPRFQAVLAFNEGEPAGLVCWSEAYHIMSGRGTMEIKHLYIRPSARGQTLGVSLLSYMLRLAKARDYWRVEGEVGGWNNQTQLLFAMLNAEKLDQIRFRLEDPGSFLRH
jgi:GNAT superfamily N-acetyltransferase